jgi:hypothetical protein
VVRTFQRKYVASLILGRTMKARYGFRLDTALQCERRDLDA